MSYVSSAVTRWLINNGAVQLDEREEYEYAVFCFLITFMPLAIVMIIGALLGIVQESVLFILPFMFIRKFSGGFHFKSTNVCMVFSTVQLTLFLLAIKYLVHMDVGLIFSSIAFLSVILLIIFSPIDSKERNLSDKEKKVFKVVVIVLSTLIYIIQLIFLYLEMMSFAIPIAGGIIITAMLQIPCIISICLTNFSKKKL